MNPLSQALAERRTNSMNPKPQAGNAMADGGADPLAQLVASLAPEQKQKLMEMLTADLNDKSDADGDQMADASGKIEDEAGETRVTAGERSALESDDTGLSDGDGDEAQPQTLRGRISQSIGKHFKK